MRPLMLTLYRALTAAYVLLFAWLGSAAPLGAPYWESLIWGVFTWVFLSSAMALLYGLMRMEPMLDEPLPSPSSL